MKRYSPHKGNQFSSNIGYKLFRYCGEYLDKETGLIYLRNRYYDSSTGRLIANQKYLAATTNVERNKAQAEMDNYHALAEDIRVLDTSGLVQRKTVQVPLYNQYNTSTLRWHSKNTNL